MNFIVVLMLMYCYGALSKEIPPYVHLCKRNDPEVDVGECFKNTTYEIMPYLIKGIPEMNAPPIDPLKVSSVNMSTGNTGSVTVNIEIQNCAVYGLRNLQIVDLKANLGDNITFTAVLTIPDVNIEGIYKMKGKILLFELNGAGHMSFNGSDIRTNSIWLASRYIKKNKIYMKIDKIQFTDVQIGNIKVKFDNLFGPNNEGLSDTVSNAINENIDTLKEELEPIIKETLMQVIRDYFNGVYRSFPMDTFFPTD